MHISVLDHIPDDSKLRAQWNALALRTRGPQVFYTWEWAVAVQRAYAATLRPILFLGYDDDGHLRGVAALESNGAGPVSFLCAATGDYCDFVVSEGDAATFVKEAMTALRQSGQRDIALTNFPEDSPSFAALRQAARRAGFRTYARTAYECAQVRLSELRVPAGAKSPLPRQRMVQRSLKALGRDGPVTIDHHSSFEAIGPLLPELRHAQASRLLMNGKISNLLRPERREFLSELTRLLSSTGWLCFSQMRAGSRTIAWHYGFRFYGRWSLYQLTFVNDLEKHSPGFVLLFKLIEAAALDPAMETADLGVGTEAYKDSFANASRRTLYVTLHRSLVKHWMETVRYRMAAAITARPRVERVARRLRARIRGLRLRAGKSGMGPTLGWLGSRLLRLIFLREEVFFYEDGSAGREPAEGCCIRPMSYEVLGEAALRSYDDEQTLQYLLRCAMRLRQGNAEGFVLIDDEGRPVHFAWATPFDGFFLTELNAKVDAPAADCVMLFDCWTPPEWRGHGYYGQAVSRIAGRLRERGKRPWIFSAASNTASVRGLEKAGFQRRYSLVRERLLGWQRIKRKTPRREAGAE